MDLTLTDLPPELIALISDLIRDFDDLARMSLVCHRVRNGVLLSQQWIVVEEIVVATERGNVTAQRKLLHDRTRCSIYACMKGLLRCVRALDLSRSEVLAYSAVWGHLVSRCAAAPGPLALGVCRYLHTTYALTAEELSTKSVYTSPLYNAIHYRHHDMFQYLHAEVGMTVPRQVLNVACSMGGLETMKYLHTTVGFTADDVRRLGMKPLFRANDGGHRDILIYLRDGYGVRKEDVDIAPDVSMYWRLIHEVFF